MTVVNAMNEQIIDRNPQQSLIENPCFSFVSGHSSVGVSTH